ncbi:dephospho-CoA kinase/protein folding accessory domain-containing protein [Microbacterium azadirachtae]|uniref:Dephospho-CoA kinase/protein folding accessory domain-containing protein n=1 Tax=Microbacterium azadirachtae TaxID=582680 RepID=A0A0F0KHV4_9MICO|nr:GrpB family protein [Microbacterium azadirachtae]KJL18841.1 dephospho-CoA kinase/protein folding accessory domain-containing protein [Microbacterium azadirachtae]
MAAPEIVSYDPSWPSVAQRWMQRIASDLAASGVHALAVEHIGSTAVPGLAAKPYVDIQVLVPRLPDEEATTAALAPAGFSRARGSRADSPGVDFDIPRPGSDPQHHEKLLYVQETESEPSVRGIILHVRRAGSSFADFVLSFRDWLRADPAAAGEYERLKRALAEQHAGAADYDDYTRAKSDFMDRAQYAMGWPRA